MFLNNERMGQFSLLDPIIGPLPSFVTRTITESPSAGLSTALGPVPGAAFDIAIDPPPQVTTIYKNTADVSESGATAAKAVQNRQAFKANPKKYVIRKYELWKGRTKKERALQIKNVQKYFKNWDQDKWLPYWKILAKNGDAITENVWFHNNFPNCRINWYWRHLLNRWPGKFIDYYVSKYKQLNRKKPDKVPALVDSVNKIATRYGGNFLENVSEKKGLSFLTHFAPDMAEKIATDAAIQAASAPGATGGSKLGMVILLVIGGALILKMGGSRKIKRG